VPQPLTVTPSRHRAVLLGCLVSIGCGGPGAPAQGGRNNGATVVEPVASSARAAEPTLPNGAWGSIVGTTLPAELSVPTPLAWKRSDGNDTLTLQHVPSHTQLLIRFWSSSRIATERLCEEQLLLLDPKAQVRTREVSSLEVMATRTFSPGEDYRGSVWSRVGNRTNGAVVGWIHGVAGGVGHCVSFDAQTEVTESNPESEMADRLALLLDGMAMKLRIRGINERSHVERPSQ